MQGSTLGGRFHAEVLPPARPQGHHFGTPVPWSGHVGEFARYAGERVCADRNGRWRPAHVFDRDSRCIYCEARA